MMTGNFVHRLEDFMCICQKESKAECESCYNRVLEELGATPEDFLSQLVYSCSDLESEQGRFYLHITGFASDQWAAISAEVSYLDKALGKWGQYRPHADIYVQCDVVEHGLARVWELAKDSTNLPVEEQ